ncbi:hypothetical protein RvY_10808 [Ramazzottius varieornatus]|uniref:EGF-like domain-containing protein n=1 Tax=Ramazzottius varieornatus TaxID=947166 RepID=A0A1D1VE03_RAMVA|nr:hypothetical protein RvY_10808 [Ramazzottius varieornatus]
MVWQCFQSALSVVFILSVLQSTLTYAFITEDIQSLEELDAHLATYRLKRSVDGPTTAPCSRSGGVLSIYQPAAAPGNIAQPTLIPSGTDSCLANGLANTRCNENNGYCECDPLVATRLRISLEVQICVPLAYVNESQGRCLPTIPDMCSVLVSGSVCQNALPPPQPGVTTRLPGLRCVCQTGNGTWPNCTPRLGSPCQNTTVCQHRIPNSFCANINQSTGFGNCLCPRANQPLGATGYLLGAGGQPAPPNSPAPFYVQTTGPNSQGTACVPLTCPVITTPNQALGPGQINPCSEDNVTPNDNTADCRDTPAGYQCTCRPGSKGRSHNSTTTGRCCSSIHLVCSDFSACFLPTDICSGTPQCANCFDESAAFSCNTPWPAQCGPVPPGRSAGSPADFAELQQLEASKNLIPNRLPLPNESQDFQAVQTRAPPAQPIASVDTNQVQSSAGNPFQGFSFSNGHANSFGNFKIEAP